MKNFIKRINKPSTRIIGIILVVGLFMVSFAFAAVGDPTVTVTSPNGGEYWRATKTVSWTASSISPSYQFYVYALKDSNPETSYTINVSGLSYTARTTNWNTLAVPDGSYIVRVMVWDSINFIEVTDDLSNSEFIVDNTPPTMDSAQTKTTTSINVTFSEDLNGSSVAAGDFTVVGNSVTNAVESSAGIVTLTLGSAIATDATPVVTLKNGQSVSDLAGNTVTGDGTGTYNKTPSDGIAPTIVSVSSDKADGNYKAGVVIDIDVTFSENVTSSGDVTVTLDTGRTCAFAVTNSNTGTCNYTVQAGDTSVDLNTSNISGTIADQSANAMVNFVPATNLAANKAIVVDTTAPTVTAVFTDTALKAGETSLVTFTFSEKVTGFTNADLTIANGTLTDVSSADGGITWTATFTPTADTTDATNVITIDNTGVVDLADNAGVGTTNSNNYTIDTLKPIVGIVVTDTALKISETSLVTFTFSEAVIGFANDDLTIVNGTLTPVTSGDSIIWTATFTPNAIEQTSNVITVGTDWTDIAGNAPIGTIDSNNYAIDTIAPTVVSVNSDEANGTYKAGEVIDIDVTFSENVTSAGVTVTLDTGQTCSFSVTNSSTGTCDYTVIAGNNSSDLNTSSISGTINDQSGNAMTNFVPATNLAANKAIVIDTTAPSGYTVNIDQTYINNANKTALSFTFASAEGGATYHYSIDDTVIGSPVTGSAVVNSATQQIKGIDVSTLNDGTLTLTVYLTDPVGNQGADATDTVTKDIVAPVGYSATIDQDPINISNEAAISFTFAGAEVGATYNYSIDDSDGATDAITGSEIIATATDKISGINVSTLNDDTLTLTVYLTDPAGNQGANATDTSTKDATAPTLTTVTIASNNAITTLAKTGDTVTITFVSDENLAATPVVKIDGNAADAVTQGGDAEHWTATRVMQADDIEEVVAFTIDFNDLVGNPGVQVTSITGGSSVTYDESAPSGYAVNIDQAYINSDNETAISFTFTGAEVGATYNYSIDDSDGATDAITGSEIIATATDKISGINVSTLNDDTLTLTVYLTDPAGNQASNTTDTVTKDTVAPDAATIIIANNDVVTKDATPALALTAGAMVPDYMSFSCDDTNWSDLVAWNTSYNSFDVTTGAGCSVGEGVKTIYVRAEDTAGNIQSTTNSDTIIYYNDTLTVDDSGGAYFTSIQSAIDNAAAGDTIEVSDGIYNEQVTINKNNLTVQSVNGAASTVINATGKDTSSGGVIFDADGATFGAPSHGFTVKDYSDETYENKILRINSDNNTIQNNIIQGNLEQAVSHHTEYGILFQSTSSGNLIDSNEVYDIGYTGINVAGAAGSSGNIVSNNNVHNVGQYAITVDRVASTSVTGNDISNIIGGVLNLFDEGDVNYNCETSCWGIVVWGAASTGTNINDQDLTDLPNGIALSSTVGVTISHSDIYNNDNIGIRMGARSWPTDPSDENEITNNNIYDNGEGILIVDTDSRLGVKNIINENKIYNNSGPGTDLYNESVVQINAKQNWWGAAQKSDIESKISGDVDFTPWYLNEGMTLLSSSDSVGPSVVLTKDIGRTVVKDADTVLITATFSSGDENDYDGLDTGVTPTITITNGSVTNADMTATGDANVWTYSWDVPSGDAVAEVSIAAKDAVGNDAQTPTGVVSYTIDNTNPDIAVTSPNGGEYWAGGSTQNIIWTSTEANKGTVAIEYSINGSDWTSVATGEADDDEYEWIVPNIDSTTVKVKVTATDLSGNIGNDQSDANFTIDSTDPTLTAVSIVSNNADTTLAKAGNTVTLSFTSNEAVQAKPVVVFTSGGVAVANAVTVTNTGGNNWAATYIVAGGDTSGAVAFTINFIDLAGNNGSQVTAVIDATAVTVDTIAPTLTEVTPVATPTNDTTPDYIFNSNEAGAITYGGDCSSATAVATAGDNTITFNTLAEATHSNCTITVTDATGNTSSVLNITAFIIDITDPTLTAVSIASDNTDTTLAKAGDTVTLSFTSDETIQADPVVTYTSGGVAVANTVIVTNTGGNNWTATYVVAGGDTSGVVAFTINFIDLAGNDGDQVAAVTDATSITVDTVAPILAEVTPVPTPANNSTPDYTFSADEAGTISYAGGCASTDTSADVGDNEITFNTLAEGTYGGCTIIVTDATGNTSIALAVTSFEVDLTSPIISNKTPGNGATTSDSTPDISADYTDAFSGIDTATVVMTVDGTDVTAFATVAGGSVSYTPVTSLADGIHTAKVDVDDLAGNSATQASWSFAIASTETTVNVSSSKSSLPADDSTTAKITAQVLDNGQPVTGATVNFTTTLGTISNVTVTNGQGRATADLTSDETGQTTVTATYDSGSGLKHGTVNVTFTEYDDIAPTISNITSSINPANAGDVLSITFDVSEALATNPSVKVDNNNATFTSKVGLIYTYVYTVTGNETEGEVTIVVSGADASNNVGTDEITDLTFDFTAPSFTVNDGTASGPVKTDTINITVTDTNGVATSKYGFSTDETCNASDTYGNTFTSATGFDITGDYTSYLCAKATDNTGNIGYELVGKLNTDNTAPTAMEQYPLDNAANVAITVNPYIDFSEAMDEATLVSSKIQLREYDTATSIDTSLTISEGGTRITIIPDSNLDYNTQYYFFISSTVTDLAGNNFGSDWQAGQKADHEFTTIAEDTPVTTYNINLLSGWNLISLPLIPDNSTIDLVLAGIVGDIANVNTVKYYDSGTWYSYVPDSGGTLATMEDGRGYWINMNASDILTINGTELPAGDGEHTPVSYTVASNQWNLMGFKSVENKTASAYLGASSADDVVWQYQTDQYHLINQSDNLEPTYGYWIFNNGDEYTIVPID